VKPIVAHRDRRKARRARRRLALVHGGGKLGLLIACSLLSACAVGPDFRVPAPAVPAAFATKSMPPTTTPQGAATPVDVAQWWHSLGDTQLDSLIDRALAGNLGLDIALARLQQARSVEAALTGYALPRIDAGAGGGRGTGSDLSRSRTPGALQSADHTLAGASRITSLAGGTAVWDLDLVGRLRRQIEAAHDDAQAALAARDALQVALVAEVASDYIAFRSLQTQEQVLRQNLRAAQDALDLVQSRFALGITNALDLSLAQRQRASVRAALAPLAAQREATGDAIAVLLGMFPEDLRAELAQPGLIPVVPARVDAGQPLDLLRRRPDIRVAEWELAGATARLGVATASLFPQISLSAGLGVQSEGLGYKPSGRQRIWSAGYSAVLPLLDFGTLDALVNIADFQAHEDLIRYRQTVLYAVKDVDRSMGGFLAQQDRLSNLADALRAAQAATGLASERYDRGLSDYLNVVDAQRQEYELAGQYAQAQGALALAYVDLYRALGGGWERAGAVPAVAAPDPALIALFRRLVFAHPAQ